MPILDHLGVTVRDLARGITQFHPILIALGFELESQKDTSVSWYKEGETEFIIFAAREDNPSRHEHGRAGWQHLAFSVDSREKVDKLYAIAIDTQWTVVREPKHYSRFNENYYAAFVEDHSGIRFEFMYNPQDKSDD